MNLIFKILLLPFRILWSITKGALRIWDKSDDDYNKNRKHQKNLRTRRTKYKQKKARENGGEVGRR